MKSLFTTLCFLTILIWGTCQDTIYWNIDTVKISENITINKNSTLIISPGTIVEFQGDYSVTVFGNLKAEGNINDSIIFTISDTSGLIRYSSKCYMPGEKMYLARNNGWGGIKFRDGENSSSLFSYCRFEYAQSADSGAAINLQNYNTLVLQNCSFQHNVATNMGGALYAENIAFLSIINNLYSDNYAMGPYGVYGGAVYIHNSEAYIEQSVFSYNHALEIDKSDENNNWRIVEFGTGGAIYYTNEIFHQFDKPMISGNFINNNSGWGSVYEGLLDGTISVNNVIVNNNGIAYYHSTGFYDFYLINNTIANNFSYLSSINPGIFSISVNGHLYNNIVWNNASSLPQNAASDYSYNNFYGGLIGEGNIEIDPHFVEPTQGSGIEYNGFLADWSLQIASPCINAGTPDTSGLNLPALDISGNPRIFGGLIDMGAYENQSGVNVDDIRANENKQLYPNPGKNLVNIILPDNFLEVRVELSSNSGQIMLKQNILGNRSSLYTGNLPSGIYLYRIYSGQTIIGSGKWVKE